MASAASADRLLHRLRSPSAPRVCSAQSAPPKAKPDSQRWCQSPGSPRPRTTGGLGPRCLRSTGGRPAPLVVEDRGRILHSPKDGGGQKMAEFLQGNGPNLSLKSTIALARRNGPSTARAESAGMPRRHRQAADGNRSPERVRSRPAAPRPPTWCGPGSAPHSKLQLAPYSVVSTAVRCRWPPP